MFKLDNKQKVALALSIVVGVILGLVVGYIVYVQGSAPRASHFGRWLLSNPYGASVFSQVVPAASAAIGAFVAAAFFYIRLLTATDTK